MNIIVGKSKTDLLSLCLIFIENWFHPFISKSLLVGCYNPISDVNKYCLI